MKLFVISDTHGRLDRVRKVYNTLTGIDLLVHLGDYEKDAAALEQEFGIDVIRVKGNMDGSFHSTDCKVLETEFGKILLTHGHMENVKVSFQNLLYRAQELECKAALFGHTHEPYLERVEGIYLLNPGSLSLPRDSANASCAVVNIKEDEFDASIVYYDTRKDINSSSEKSKVEGGYLKNLLNNSDRF